MVDNVFVPNKRYLLERELEAALDKKPGPGAATMSTRKFSGATYLFDQIGEKLGVTADLQSCFPEIWKQLLSIAYYLILEDKNPLSRFPHWANNHRHPYGEIDGYNQSRALVWPNVTTACLL